MHHLLFRVHGPICGWGDIAPGTHRPTFTMPTRSSLLGLIASAFGISRQDDAQHDALSAGLGIGARMESAGVILSDYHTVQTARRERRAVWPTRRDELINAAKVNTILSTRDYIQDAAYTIALWRRPDGQINLADVRARLASPRYPPYLGRRSCPTALPFYPHLVDAESLREAFDKAQFPELDREVISHLRRRQERLLRVEFDDHPTPGYDRTLSHPQRDDAGTRSRRSFRDRTVHTAVHILPETA